MTSLAFTIGVLPLAISSGAGAGSRHAIGTGVIGGMIASTTIAIFFAPLFYNWLARLNAKFTKKGKTNSALNHFILVKTSLMNKYSSSLESLMALYRGKKHPLNYTNRYQLLVIVILSAQDSDKHINQLIPAFLEIYPDMQTLALAQPEDLHKIISSVRNFGNKSNWLVKLAQIVQKDENIPTTMTELTQLPGIGRKSANVIMREAGVKAEGIIVDLHVVRVAPRIGLATGTQPEKIEKQLMAISPAETWGELGMAISFLGREICRPTNPKCPECVMNTVCTYLHPPSEKDLFS
jgi:endonuclease-3